ncbi:hypothetical protein [Micromonospora sp. NBS 11-29]|uniref:hypothetical protein n=1 Tax=Micromonospora sp. NBS 11-29 TaxID=1960879 RepID=UPI000B7759E1|nr:hypothetical protein [Micromonospora sp. NBS 11-29]
MIVEAIGPEQIRAAFSQAVAATGERAEEVGGVAGILGDAADRYEALQMQPSTVERLREAGAAFATAHAALVDAREQLDAALADFNNHDGQVADAVAEAGGTLASRESLIGDGITSTSSTDSSPAPTPSDPPAHAERDTRIADPDAVRAAAVYEDAGRNIAAAGVGCATCLTAATDAHLASAEHQQATVGRPALFFGGGALHLGDGSDDPYLDWSMPTTNGGRCLEIGDGQNAVQLDLTGTQLRELVDALTATITADDFAEAPDAYWPARARRRPHHPPLRPRRTTHRPGTGLHPRRLPHRRRRRAFRGITRRRSPAGSTCHTDLSCDSRN